MTKTPTLRAPGAGSTLAVGLALLLTAGGAGVGLSTANQAAQRAAELHRADRQQTASSVAALEDAVVRDLRTRATAAAQTAAVQTAGSAGTDPSRLRAAAQQVSPQATAAVLIDAQGHTRASWQAAPGTSAPLPALTPPAGGVSLLLAGAGGNANLAVWAPIPTAAATGSATAQLMVVVPAAATGLQAPLAELRMGRTGFAQLVDPAGAVVASTTGSGVGLRDQASTQPHMVSSTEPLAALPGAGWHVVVAQSKAEFAAGTDAGGLGWALLLAVAGLLAGLGVLAGSFVRVRARARHRVEVAPDLMPEAVLTAVAMDSAPPRPMATPKEFLAATRRALVAHDRVGLICLRVDSLDLLIDQVGHAAVDDAMTVLGRRLQRSVPEGGAAGRLGGDEFAIVCPAGAMAEDVIAAALRVEQVVQAPVAVGGWKLRLGVTVGAADGSADDGATAEDLLRDAHRALRVAEVDGSAHSVAPVVSALVTQGL